MPAAPAPPAAPAAPASPAAPAKTDIQVPGEQPEKDWMAEVGQDLEALDEDNQPARPATGQKPRAKAKEKEEELPIEPKEEKTTDEELEDLGNKDKSKEDTEKGKPKEEEMPTSAPELRKAFKELKSKLKEAEPTIQKLQSRVKELESAGPAKPDEGTVKKLTDLEKRNADLEQRIQFLDYEQSEEYQTKFNQPHIKAWERAMADLNEMQVEDSEGTARAAKPEDLMYLTGLPLGEARKKANAMFGDSADDVMFHVREVRRLAEAQRSALDEAKKNSVERAKTAQTELVRKRTEAIQQFDTANKELSTRYPGFFAEKEGDADGNGLLKKGFALADLMFRPDKVEADLLPASFKAEMASKGRLSPQNIVRLHALIRNKVANHDRLALRLGSALKELKQVKKALADYEGSAPPEGGGTRRRSKAPTLGGYLDEANAELEQLDNANL